MILLIISPFLDQMSLWGSVMNINWCISVHTILIAADQCHSVTVWPLNMSNIKQTHGHGAVVSLTPSQRSCAALTYIKSPDEILYLASIRLSLKYETDHRRRILSNSSIFLTWKRKASPTELLRQKTKSFLGCSGTAWTMLFSTHSACLWTLLWSMPERPSDSYRKSVQPWKNAKKAT